MGIAEDGFLISSFSAVHFSIFDLIARWQGEECPSTLDWVRSHATHVAYTSNSTGSESNFCRAAQSFPQFFSAGADRNSIWPKSCVNTWRSVYIFRRPRRPLFISVGSAAHANGGQNWELWPAAGPFWAHFNAWEEKMRLGADQFLFIRDGLFIFFGLANCSPIIIQTPLCALCVYKKLM